MKLSERLRTRRPVESWSPLADETGISWTDVTFNPWLGCVKVSPACAHCYAETMTENRMGLHVWGADAPRRIAAESTWKKPLRWDRESETVGRTRYGGGAGERIRVFCASMADVFEPRPDLDAPRRRLLDLIAETPHLDWLLLTKRPDVARDLYFDGGWTITPNLWLGTSIENSRFTWRADILRQIPVAVRFISAEPLLGSLFSSRGHTTKAEVPNRVVSERKRSNLPDHESKPLDLSGIGWVIVGGESGGRFARPMHPDWVREIRNACVTGSPLDPIHFGAGIMADGGASLLNLPFHFKQWGSYAPRGFVSGKNDVDQRHEKTVAGDPRSNREGGRVDWRTFFYGAGPKSGGKILDSIEWCEFPVSPAAAMAYA